MAGVTTISSDSSAASSSSSEALSSDEASSSSSDEGRLVFRRPNERSKMEEPQLLHSTLKPKHQFTGLATVQTSLSHPQPHTSAKTNVPPSIQDRLPSSSLLSHPSAFPKFVPTKRRNNLAPELRNTKRVKSQPTVEPDVTGKRRPEKTDDKPLEHATTRDLEIYDKQNVATNVHGPKPTESDPLRTANRMSNTSRQLNGSVSQDGLPAKSTEAPSKPMPITLSFAPTSQAIDKTIKDKALSVDGQGPVQDADAEIEALHKEIEDMKAAIKDVVKYGEMLTAHEHGKLGGAIQVLKAKLLFVWAE